MLSGLSAKVLNRAKHGYVEADAENDAKYMVTDHVSPV